ncbi:MAG: hypothetical protein ACRDRO_06355 [Pseudonocardiaceae bacterium]
MQVASIFTPMDRPGDHDHGRDRDDRTGWRSRGNDGRWRYWHQTWDDRRHQRGGYWGW